MSLLELVMAVSIIASALLVVLTVMPHTHAALRQHAEYVVGTRFCHRMSEHYRRKPFTALKKLLLAGGESGQQAVFATSDGTPTWINFTWQLTRLSVPAPAADLAKLQLSAWDPAQDTLAWSVTVRWTSYAGGAQAVQRSLTLTSQTRRGDYP